MESFYFTFGSNHETEGGFSLGMCFVEIKAESEWRAREMMHEARGPKWAFSYTAVDFAGQQEEYGLSRLTLEQVRLSPHNRAGGY